MPLPAHMQQQEASPQKLGNSWEKQQQKAFTAWCNSHLRQRNLKITDIETELSDGHMLLQLMEVVGDVKLPKPAKLKLRIHKIQNVNHVIKYITEKGVKLVGIGAEEIVDENLKLILGMLWTIILRFDIQDISVEQASAKDALLLWAKRKTAGYAGVNVENFHMSFKDGLAFCALIHKHRPDLLDYDTLRKGNTLENVGLAMRIAEEHLDMVPMIDPEDMAVAIKPDERSVMTQVAAFYKIFASYNKGEVAAGKIATVLKTNLLHDQLITEYEEMATTLLEWLPQAIARLEERPALSTVDDCLGYLKAFEDFRTREYPAKLNEKGQLEAHYSSLQTKLRLSGRAPFVASEGRQMEQINRAWEGLDKADLDNKHWVLEQLRRAQICGQKAESFAEKAATHERWTAVKEPQLTVDDYSSANLGALNALIKKHEAFRSDLLAHETRVHDIGTLANELDDMAYFNAADVNARYAQIYEMWQNLVALTDQRGAALGQAYENQQKLEEVWLQIATNAAPLVAFLDETKSQLSRKIYAESEADVEQERASLAEVRDNLAAFESDYANYSGLVAEADKLGGGDNPFTLYTTADITSLWDDVKALVPVREQSLSEESARQAGREDLRKQWATKAHETETWWLTKTGSLRIFTDNDSDDPLEQQLEQIKAIHTEVEHYYTSTYPQLEALNKRLEEEVILENSHTHFTMEILRGKYFQLITQLQSISSSLENQIVIRDTSNITEEQMKDFHESFAHFDKDKSGQLSPLEFRGCLLSLGVDIPAEAVPGQDAEFERIMSRVDPNGDGHISFSEFVAFMSEERADAETKDDFLAQFQVLAGDQPYILPNQLHDLPKELADYCVANMPAFAGGPDGALDYVSFAETCYGSADV